MKSFNPTCKPIGLTVPTLLLARLHHPAINLIASAVCLAALPLPRANVKALAGALLPMFLMAVGMFSTGYHFHAGMGMPIDAAAQALTGTAVWNGLALDSRVLAFAGLGLLLVFTTGRILLMRSPQQQLRLPPVFAYGLLAAQGILPNATEEYKCTRAVLVARGVRVFPVSLALLKSLLVKPVCWSEELLTAMGSRGFDGRVPRTCSQPLRLRPVDVLFFTLSCALFPAPFFLLGR